MKNQIILQENRHCDPDLTITANGHDSATTNNHNLHENDLPTNEDENPDFSRKSDYFEIMSELVDDEEVDNNETEYVTIPTNKNFSFASSNGNGSLVGGARWGIFGFCLLLFRQNERKIYKVSQLNLSQFVYFLREVCSLFNF